MQLGQCSGDPESPGSMKRGSQCRSALPGLHCLGADGYVELEGLETGCKPVADSTGLEEIKWTDGTRQRDRAGLGKEPGRYAAR